MSISGGTQIIWHRLMKSDRVSAADSFRYLMPEVYTIPAAPSLRLTGMFPPSRLSPVPDAGHCHNKELSC
jgi:hypothetical protein